TTGEVVRRQLDLHLVAREDPDVVLPHLPRDRCENAVPAFELDPEHRARQRLCDLAFDLDLVLLLGQIPFGSTLHIRFENLHKKARGSPPRAGGHRSKLGSSRRVRIRGPSSVTATVCSKCAESDPSSVEIDHSSSWRYTSGPPALIIGSIASVIPGCSS